MVNGKNWEKGAADLAQHLVGTLIRGCAGLYPCRDSAIYGYRAESARMRASGADALADIYAAAANQLARAYGQPEALTLDALNLEDMGIHVPAIAVDVVPETTPEAGTAPKPAKATPVAKAPPAPAHDDGLGW